MQHALNIPLLEEIYQQKRTNKDNLQQLKQAYILRKEDDKLFDLALSAIKDFPEDAAFYEIIGIYYSNHNQPELALEYIIKANDLYMWKNSDCLYNMAMIYKRLDEFKLAILLLERLLQIDPDKEKASLQLSFIKMAMGEWPEALAIYESRWQVENDIIGNSIAKQLPMLKRATSQMMGNDIQVGDTIFVYPEQGTGDFFHFMRYFSHMQNHGFKISFMERQMNEEASKRLNPLHRLLHLCSGINEIALQGTVPKNSKAYIPLMSLPLLCQTSFQAKEGLAQIPPPVPISIPNEVLNYWRNFLKPAGAEHGFKHSINPPFIGIAYRGNLEAKSPEGRYIPLDHLLHQLAITLNDQTGTILILQKDVLDRDQVLINAFCETHPKVNVIHPINTETDFLDVAAILPLLDFVVSTDTALVHLAGNQGVCPVFMPLMKPFEWRWLLDREDSPWYPNLTLIRQQTNEPWEIVLESLAMKIKSSTKKC